MIYVTVVEKLPTVVSICHFQWHDMKTKFVKKPSSAVESFMAASLSLVLKSSGIHLRLQKTLLQHTSRGVHQPNVDRYITIRLFFKRQLASTHVNTLGGVGLGLNGFSNARLCASKRTHILPRFKSWTRFNHSDAQHKPQDQSSPRPDSHKTPEENSSDVQPSLPPLNLENYPRLYRRLAASLSHLHRPSKDDFLNVANGFWQRMRIHFKWFTIRSFRRFNADDISAFITWFLMSQTLWIFIGT